MAKKHKEADELSYFRKMMMLKNAGIGEAPKSITLKGIENELLPLNERIQLILGIVNQKYKTNDMIFFIMYDIENDKIRTQLSKYLKKKGCTRIQKSIFLIKTERSKFAEIAQTLKEINELYDNEDSIIMIPVSTDEIRAMKLIGQNVDIDIILQNKNTLFF